MLEPKITIDKAKMLAIKRALRGHQRSMGRLVYRALRDTVKHGRTLFDRAIRQRIMVKKKDVMNRIIEIERPSYTHWRAKLGISSKRLSLGAFGSVTQKKRGGVSYTISRGRRKTVPHAFILRNPKNPAAGKAVFRRVMIGEAGFDPSKATKRGILPGRIVSRTPLKFLRGPSIGQVVKDAPAILRDVERQGAAKLSTELDRHVKLELERRMPR